MTLTADTPLTAPPSGRSDSPTVWALVHATGDTGRLEATLHSILGGTRRPDGVLVLDASGAGVASGAGRAPGLVERTTRVVADGVPHRDGGAVVDVRRVEVGAGLSARAAFNTLLSHDTCPDAAAADLVWFLDDTTTVDARALDELTGALGRSRSTAAVGPKVLSGPGALRSVGIVATRSGRVLADPVPGDRDQGQCDGRSDVLALPAAGQLVETSAWRALGGFPTAFGDVAADLDLGWRMHRAGHRVSAVPSARVVSGAQLGGATTPTRTQRRAVRRVALARCSWLGAPFLALWVLLSGLVSGLGLLLLKRPRAGLDAWGDVGALLTPWASLASRWRGRRIHTVARRDLRALFAGPRDVSSRAFDLVHEAYAPDRNTTAVDERAIETGPTEAGEESIRNAGSLLGRLLTGPGTLAALAATVATVVALRRTDGLWGSLVHGGLVGGELPGGRLDVAALLAPWWTGFGGPGLGEPVTASPAGALLAGPAWLAAHLPFADVIAPGGVALSWLLVLALPAAAVSAHLAGRAVTRSPWPRAIVALLWAVNPVSLAIVGDGRLGAAVLLIGVPLIAAAIARVHHGQGTMAAAGGASLVLAGTAAFAPGVLVPALLALLPALVLGGDGRRGRAFVAIVGTLLLLGPWTAELVSRPALLLHGPGLTAFGTPAPDLAHLLALAPDARLGGLWWVGGGVAVLAFVSLLRHRRPGAQWALAVVALAGGAATLAAARVRLDVVPDTMALAGQPIRPWWGAAMLLTLLGLLGLVLVGLADLSLRRRLAGRVAFVRWPYAVVSALVALGLAGLVAWTGAGSALTPWREPRPAIAVDQAGGPLANRTLLLGAVEDGIGQQVVSLESGSLGRDVSTPTSDPAVVSAVQALLADGTGSVAGLRELGIGFVGLRTDLGADLPVLLDATEGLTRMGSREGLAYWRLTSAPTADGTTTTGVPRVAVVGDGTRTVVPVDGPAGQVDTTVQVRAGERLVVAAPLAWDRAMTVTADGRVLGRTTGTAGLALPTYELPEGDVELSIHPARGPQLVHLGQAVLALCLLVLAIPTGRRRRSAR